MPVKPQINPGEDKMTMHNKQVKYFVEEGAPIPMHMLMMEEMPVPQYGIRLAESKTARTESYVCAYFYKPISRSLPMEVKEENYDRKS